MQLSSTSVIRINSLTTSRKMGQDITCQMQVLCKTAFLKTRLCEDLWPTRFPDLHQIFSCWIGRRERTARTNLTSLTISKETYTSWCMQPFLWTRNISPIWSIASSCAHMSRLLQYLHDWVKFHTECGTRLQYFITTDAWTLVLLLKILDPYNKTTANTGFL